MSTDVSPTFVASMSSSFVLVENQVHTDTYIDFENFFPKALTVVSNIA
jgi:hypothetical protein